MKKNFSILFVIFLTFYVLYVSAIPATRTKNLEGDDSSVFPSLTKEQGSLKLENGEEIMENMDERLERRIDLDIQDYGGTGANKDHDPKSPGNDGN
ncbi:uncharacterized protein [Cicer arietinum]|uniref:Uncharacterized protein LOC101490115 n=1 Tax=Cicer arietinum TaxID=3827 RepID=A0A1S2XHZ9_CICAR|nr:uncharacterized protein LOC101490115 [Cicer arietinum]